MKPIDAVKEAASRTGTPITAIGPAIGKTKTYVSSIAGKESRPRCDTLVSMLGACGYKLCAIPRDSVPESAIVIE